MIDDDTIPCFLLRTIGRSVPGTVVAVKRIFERLPVRRGAVRIDQEIIKVKELIRKLSVAHHSVNFNLYPLHRGKILLQLPGQSSLLQRLSQLHNCDLLHHYMVSI